ncbi:MAG: SIMPL domain-containing protein [Steroidobacteraceae bacterium]
MSPLRSSLVVIVGSLTFFVPAARAVDTTAPRTISVTGEAEREIMPDRAHLTLAVEVRRSTVDEARVEVNQRVDALLRMLAEPRIPKQDIDSTALEVRADLSWNPQTGQQRLQGYIVQRSLRVRLSELDKLGAVLERSLKAGVNQLSPPSFSHSRQDELRHEVLGAATLDARRNAIAAAAGIGMSVGPAQRIELIEEGGGVMPMVSGVMRVAATPDVATEAPYQPAQLTLRVRVRASFDLIP